MNASSCSQLAPPKGETRKRLKGRADRAEATVKKAVRAWCVERDGDCRLGDWERNPYDWHDDCLEGDECDGRSEWAHLGDKKRARTRGQAPEVRHTANDSLMLCTKHHQDYDQGRLVIAALYGIDPDAERELEFKPASKREARD